MEGPACDIDINECVRGTAGCATNAACINSDGGYTCKCFKGFSGNASKECLPEPGAGKDVLMFNCRSCRSNPFKRL